MAAQLLPQLVGLAILLFLSAFFSGSETALFSLSRVQVQRLREAAGRTGRAVAELLSRPRRLLVTILVGNMIVNVAAASIVATIVTTLLGENWVGVAIGVTTLLLLIFGEVTPKTFAVRNAEPLSRVAALPLLGFAKVIAPIRLVLWGATSPVLFALRLGRIQSESVLTGREFRAALEVGQEAGAIGEHEREMVERICDLRHMDAREIMVPRTQMVCVEDNATIGEALEAARRSRHTRLPVYSGEIDEVWGIFDVKDLPAWRGVDLRSRTIREFVAFRDAMPEPPQWPLVRRAFFVPETRHVDDLLRDMREKGAHMAILLDEYGGTSGLVTLRRLVDVIVGGVLAKGPGALFRRNADGSFEILGEAYVRDVNHELGLGLPLDEADTMGGYVLSLFGKLPKPGQEVSDERFVFKVLRLSGRRIGAVEVRPQAPPAAPTQEGAEQKALGDDAGSGEKGAGT